MKSLLLLSLIFVPSFAFGLTSQGWQCSNEGGRCFSMSARKSGVCTNHKCVVEPIVEDGPMM